MSVKEEFINECIRNRTYLGYTYKDMSNCLVNVSEKEYKEFENGRYDISKENANRLIRVLCIEKPKYTNLNLDFFEDELSDNEKEDLVKIAKKLAGDFDD